MQLFTSCHSHIFGHINVCMFREQKTHKNGCMCLLLVSDQPLPAPTSSVGPVIGGIIATIIILCLIGAGVAMYHKRRQSMENGEWVWTRTHKHNHTFMSNIHFLLSISFLARTSRLFLCLSFSMHPNWCVHGIACMRTTVIAKHPVVFPFQRPPETQAASSDEVWQLDRNGEQTFLHQSPLSAHIWQSLSTLTYWAFFIIQCWDYLQFSRLHAAIKTELVKRRIGINHHKIDLWIQTFEEQA